MVAVHTVPARRDRPPVHDPSDAPARSGRPSVARPGARALPDRATRVRRRRLALLVAGVAAVTVSWLAVRAFASLTEAGPSDGPETLGASTVPVAGQQYVVQPGDTLWSIATDIAPGADPRPVVDALRAANGDVELEVGEVLTLEVG